MNLDESLVRVLACPRCHGPIDVGPTRLACKAERCGYAGRAANGVLLFADEGADSFFDERTDAMDRVVNDPGTRAVFYEAQGGAARRHLAGAPVILDVGCGAALQYPRPTGSRVIGLDLSIGLLRQNKDLDVAVYGSATELPIADHSVDRIVCFYAVHHFIGGSVAANRGTVERAFAEFGRALRPGGELLVFDLSPWWLLWRAQCMAWNGVRRMLGSRLDMFFWRANDLEQLAARQLGRPAHLDRDVFGADPLMFIPAGVGLSWLRVPRVLYPFKICLYRWRLA
jgi:SAM-dependent methyltransferase